MKTALLIDDSAYMRTLLNLLISMHDLVVIGEAENGKIGVEKYKELKPDIVFMDIMMEEMSGLEALRQIIEYDPGAVVVVVSSMMQQRFFIEDAMSFGAKAVLTKPPNESNIAELLAKLF